MKTKTSRQTPERDSSGSGTEGQLLWTEADSFKKYNERLNALANENPDRGSTGETPCDQNAERKRGHEFTTDSAALVATGGIKYDGGKSPVWRGVISYFPNALRAVADVSAFGAVKYAWNGWKDVPDAVERYSDALVRHLTAEGMGETRDEDSGFAHAAHTAWNALARLELLLRNDRIE